MGFTWLYHGADQCLSLQTVLLTLWILQSASWSDRYHARTPPGRLVSWPQLRVDPNPSRNLCIIFR